MKQRGEIKLPGLSVFDVVKLLTSFCPDGQRLGRVTVGLMPRFYLHVHDTLDAIDEEGMDLPHFDDAYAEAISGLRCILAAQVRDGRLATHTHVSINNDDGKRLGVVTFIDAIAVSVAN